MSVIMDLGDEDGHWTGCLGHVDRYDFLVALADLMGDEAMVLPSNPPQHAYMVEFGDDDSDRWFQLDGTNSDAIRIEPITVIANDGPPLSICRAMPLPDRKARATA